MWVAKVYSLHLAPSQEELMGSKSQHYLPLWHQEPLAEVTIRGTSWEQPNKLTQLEQGGRAGVSLWDIPVWHMKATGKLRQGKGHPGS